MVGSGMTEYSSGYRTGLYKRMQAKHVQCCSIVGVRNHVQETVSVQRQEKDALLCANVKQGVHEVNCINLLTEFTSKVKTN